MLVDVVERAKDRPFLEETLRAFGYEDRDLVRMSRPAMVRRIEGEVEREKAHHAIIGVVRNMPK